MKRRFLVLLAGMLVLGAVIMTTLYLFKGGGQPNMPIEHERVESRKEPGNRTKPTSSEVSLPILEYRTVSKSGGQERDEEYFRRKINTLLGGTS